MALGSGNLTQAPKRFVGSDCLALTCPIQRNADQHREAAWDDYLYWQKQDRKMVERINKLIEVVKREPFSGVGKPEPLKHALASF